MFRLLIIPTLVLAIAGCSTTQSIGSAELPSGFTSTESQRAEIRYRNGESETARILDVTTDTMLIQPSGRSARTVPLADVEKVLIRESSSGKTVIAVVGVVGIAALMSGMGDFAVFPAP